MSNREKLANGVRRIPQMFLLDVSEGHCCVDEDSDMEMEMERERVTPPAS